jgi:glycosyltransferase involved in cell wall biosynthesis
MIRETGAGVLYPSRSPQDPGALAEAIHTLVNDHSLRRTCAEASARAARETYNWERESLRLVDAWDLVEQRR